MGKVQIGDIGSEGCLISKDVEPLAKLPEASKPDASNAQTEASNSPARKRSRSRKRGWKEKREGKRRI
ncbi:unnamed protein product [Gordionus sp. m RMFG-2023]